MCIKEKQNISSQSFSRSLSCFCSCFCSCFLSCFCTTFRYLCWTSSRTTDANLDCALVEKALGFVILKFGGRGLGPLALIYVSIAVCSFRILPAYQMQYRMHCAYRLKKCTSQYLLWLQFHSYDKWSIALYFLLLLSHFFTLHWPIVEGPPGLEAS